MNTSWRERRKATALSEYDENKNTGSLGGGGQTKLRIEELGELRQGIIDQTKTSSRGGGAKTKMRIGAVNVRTVRRKMDLIVEMMEHHGVDVLAALETRLKKELEPAAKKSGRNDDGTA